MRKKITLPEAWEIEEAWDEAEELNCSLRELNDDELVDCRQALLDRTKKIMSLLDKGEEH